MRLVLAGRVFLFGLLFHTRLVMTLRGLPQPDEDTIPEEMKNESIVDKNIVQGGRTHRRLDFDDPLRRMRTVEDTNDNV